MDDQTRARLKPFHDAEITHRKEHFDPTQQNFFAALELREAGIEVPGFRAIYEAHREASKEQLRLVQAISDEWDRIIAEKGENA